MSGWGGANDDNRPADGRAREPLGTSCPVRAARTTTMSIPKLRSGTYFPEWLLERSVASHPRPTAPLRIGPCTPTRPTARSVEYPRPRDPTRRPAAHQGLVEAIADLPGAVWQRCRTHYAANLMSVTPKAMWPAVKAMLHSVYDQPDADAVPSSCCTGASPSRPRHPRLHRSPKTGAVIRRSGGRRPPLPRPRYPRTRPHPRPGPER